MPMSHRFTVLASGSSGNASLIEANGFGLLLDSGLGPRQLASRLKAFGISWQRVRAVLLTHTHGDHWHDRTFAHLRRQRIPLYCHTDHAPELRHYSPRFAELEAAQLVRCYEAKDDLWLTPHLRCRPLALPHDSNATFGFRFDLTIEDGGQQVAIGYAADLGSWTMGLVQALADVDLLALEFNHDIEMEHASGRSPQLIARVLGDHGHLSNCQAAVLLGEVLGASAPGRLQHVVQLHLSQECNRPALALAAAQSVVREIASQVRLHTAHQNRPGPSIPLEPAWRSISPRSPEPVAAPALAGLQDSVWTQSWLPGFDGGE